MELIDGQKGELTVLVDGHEVARKQGDALPSAEVVKAAVEGTPAGAG